MRSLRHIAKLFLIAALIVSCQSNKGYSYERPVIDIEKNVKDEYLGLYFLEKKIGYFHGSVYEGTYNGKKVYHVIGDALIRADLEGQKLYTMLKEEMVLDAAYKVIYFAYTQKIGDSGITLMAVKKGSDYMLKSITGGQEDEDKIGPEFLPLSAAGFIVWKEGIKEDKEYKFRVFVEALQKTENLTIKVGKKTIEDGKTIYPLHQKLGNIEITSYVLENGDTYKEQSIQGFTMKKLDKKEALSFDDKDISLYDIFSFTYVPAAVPREGDVNELVMELSGFDKNAVVPQSVFQKVEKKDDKLIVTTSKKPQSEEKFKGDAAPYLAKSAKIQKDSPEIKTLAETITAAVQTPHEKAALIVDWVNKNIKKRLRDKTSALEVLRSKEGECEAHSILTAALLRSINIPAKVVGGVVYSKEYKGFLYHAWNEVLLDGVFVPVDATFGEFPANPSHIKFTEEGNMEDVVLFIGKLKIKVLKSN